MGIRVNWIPSIQDNPWFPCEPVLYTPWFPCEPVLYTLHMYHACHKHQPWKHYLSIIQSGIHSFVSQSIQGTLQSLNSANQSPSSWINRRSKWHGITFTHDAII